MFNNIPKDKLLHFIAGVVAYSVALTFVDPANAFLISVLIGLLKEIVDLFNPNSTPDVCDFTATSVGALTGLCVSLISF